MVPLRIECRLAGPWCPPAFGLHFDSLIGWSMVEQARASRRDEPDYESILARLPFARHESGVWCASLFAVVNPLGQERRYLTAKTPADHMARLIGRRVVDEAGGSVIDTQRGPFKNGQAYHTVEHAQGLRAWCIGDPDQIVDHLVAVAAVGVKTRLGLGTLLPFDGGELWQVSEDPDAVELWKQRAAPVPLTDDAIQAVGAWRPPYWQGSELIWRPLVRRIAEPWPSPAGTLA